MRIKITRETLMRLKDQSRGIMDESKTHIDGDEASIEVDKDVFSRLTLMAAKKKQTYDQAIMELIRLQQGRN